MQWFPSLCNVVRSIPGSLLLKLSPEMAVTKEWEDRNKMLVREIVEKFNPMHKENKTHRNIFHELLASDLPAREKSYERLWQEGSALIGAGVETTSNTLNVALCHFLSHPNKLNGLKNELRDAMPSPSNIATWSTPENLPY